MNKNEILSKVDHTLLKVTATENDIKKICDEAINAKTASVCIPQCYVKMASEYVNGKIPICTVIGFPNGNSSTTIKAMEAAEAFENGASEIDMVVNIGQLKAKNYDYVKKEIYYLACLAHENAGILKVIIETCLLEDEEIEKMCHICAQSGADYIKTSTGFSTSGANEHVLEIMAKTIKENNLPLKIKAAGGISDKETAIRFLEIGADRLGTSKLIDILNKED